MLLSGLIASGIVAWQIPIEILIRYATDDAYFFLKIADNLASGRGSTFDGLHATNGYHPLWLLVLTAAFTGAHRVELTSPEQLLRVAAFLMMIAGGVAAWQIGRAMQAVFPAVRIAPAALLTCLAAAVLFIDSHFAMESVLVVLLISLYIRGRTMYSARPWLVPLLLPFLFLTRIDFLTSLVPALAVLHIAEQRAGTRVRTALLTICPTIAVAAAYFAFNNDAFGTAVPISAAIKSTFPRVNALENLRTTYASLTEGDGLAIYNIYNACRIFLPLFIYPAFYWIVWRGSFGRARDLDNGLVACAFGATALVLSHLMFNQELTALWVTALPACVAVVMLFRASIEGLWAGLVTNTALAASVAVFVGVHYVYSPQPAGYGFAIQIARVTQPSDVLFQIDGSGTIGYFSGRHVINGDGLVNTVAYRGILEEGRLAEYLRDESVDYFVSNQMIDLNAGVPGATPVYQEDMLPEDAKAAMTCASDAVVLHSGDWILCRARAPETTN